MSARGMRQETAGRRGRDFAAKTRNAGPEMTAEMGE